MISPTLRFVKPLIGSNVRSLLGTCLSGLSVLNLVTIDLGDFEVSHQVFVEVLARVINSTSFLRRRFSSEQSGTSMCFVLT